MCVPFVRSFSGKEAQTFSGAPKFGDRYDWMTGGPCDGHEWRKYRVRFVSVVQWSPRPVIFGPEKWGLLGGVQRVHVDKVHVRILYKS